MPTIKELYLDKMITGTLCPDCMKGHLIIIGPDFAACDKCGCEFTIVKYDRNGMPEVIEYA